MAPEIPKVSIEIAPGGGGMVSVKTLTLTLTGQKKCCILKINGYFIVLAKNEFMCFFAQTKTHIT